ncbi:MAG: hypothetical protein M3347_07590 [Armatimonadota bacterium]|nr:hypothetical protein [Armatimonadota bacterium]
MVSKSVVPKVAGKMVAGVVALGVAGGFLGGPEAQAHRRDFPFTYDWFQPAKGEKEIELHSRYRGRNNSFQQQIEFEYGITDRLMIAPYLVFEKELGGNLKYTEWKLESRYQLGEFQTGKVLPGVYLEYVGTKDGPDEVEGKLILSRYGKNGDNLSFNYIIERELEGGAEFENVYSIGYARSLGKKNTGFLGKRGARAGFEWIHNLSSGRINAGPILGLSPAKNSWIVAGYAHNINDRGGNRPEFRLLFEYEWF